MEFPGGNWGNGKWNFQGFIKNNWEFPKGDQEQIVWNFQGSWFQALTQFGGVTSRGEALFCLKFPGVK